MQYKKPLLCLSSWLRLPASRFGQQQHELTYVDLVKRLTDLEYLATVPAPGEQCAQWSSYDRRSRYDAATGKYVGWDANGDGNGIIRKEDGKLVLAEMEGPGCIWRIWSAAPKQGHVRIYLDGASEPAVDLPFVGYFDRKNEPFTRSAIVHTVANGWNNYTPIPYQKSCKVVADPGWGDYYHFTYGTFPKGTKVPTFKRELSAADLAALDQANAVLSHCGFGAGQKQRRREGLEQGGQGPGRQDHRGHAAEGPAGHHRDPRETRPAASPGRLRRAARAGLADQVGWRDDAQRVGAAGRFLRHGPRGQPLPLAAAGHGRGWLVVLQLVHAVREGGARGTGQRRQGATERELRGGPCALVAADRATGTLPRQVASGRVPAEGARAVRLTGRS